MLLNIADIDELPSLPRHKYFLRVGDRIKYKRYEFPHGDVEGTIVAIENDAFGVLSVRTDCGAVLDKEHNPGFQILESVHNDSPLLGKHVSIRRVNLVRETTDNSGNKRKLLDEALEQNLPGIKIAVMAAATHKAVKQARIDSVWSPVVTRSKANMKNMGIK